MSVARNPPQKGIHYARVFRTPRPGAVLPFGIVGGGGNSEPSKAAMKEAMLYEMNHPPSVVNGDPITIKSSRSAHKDPPHETRKYESEGRIAYLPPSL